MGEIRLSESKPGGRGRDVRLLTRKVESQSRVFFAASDIAILLWLVAGLPLSLLRCTTRWALCRELARLALFGSRAAGATQALVRIANVDVGVARHIVRTVYAGRLCSQLDLLRGLVKGPDLEYDCRGLEQLETALAQGRGAVLWVSDFVGAGEAVKVAFARAGYRVSHLTRPEHGFSKTRFAIRFLNPIRIRFESAYLKERVVYNRSHPRQAVNRLVACLAQNGVVSVTASMHEGRRLVEGRLLAGRLRLAIGAPKIALRNAAVLIPVHAIRDRQDPCRFQIILDPPLPLSHDIAEPDAILAAVDAYLDGLETQIRLRPEAWGGWRRVGALA